MNQQSAPEPDDEKLLRHADRLRDKEARETRLWTWTSRIGIIFGAMALYGVFRTALILFSEDRKTLVTLQTTDFVVLYSAAILLVGGIIYVIWSEYSTELKFSDIDSYRRRAQDVAHLLKVQRYRDEIAKEDRLNKILSDLEELKGSTISQDQITDLWKAIKEAQQDAQAAHSGKKEESLRTFEEYFLHLKSVLEDKASIADQKASILLDKGVTYSRMGIILYVLSIIGWQVASWSHGFQPQFIYGIASTSLLFVFIEFLSAWFLKQYQHFINTSTYLIKVKSIFDRYMLTYLASKDETLNKNEAQLASMISILKDEIKWPDSYLGRDPDVNLAREMLDSMATLATSMRKDGDKK